MTPTPFWTDAWNTLAEGPAGLLLVMAGLIALALLSCEPASEVEQGPMVVQGGGR